MATDMETVNIAEGIQSGEYDKEGDFQPSTSMETCEGEFRDGGGEGISSEMLDYLVSTEDSYNFELCVSVTETETDEVNAEFSVAIAEIDGLKSFPCSQCEKICKSKGGLTRQIRNTATVNSVKMVKLLSKVLPFVKRQCLHLLKLLRQA